MTQAHTSKIQSQAVEGKLTHQALSQSSLDQLVNLFFESKQSTHSWDETIYNHILAAIEPDIKRLTYKAYDLKEDAANEARLRIWVQLGKMKTPPDSSRAYFCRIISHTIADTLNKNVKVEEAPMDNIEVKDGTTPWDTLEAKDRQDYIVRFLKTVKNKQHVQIALLHWKYEYSKADIAREINVNESTVNTNIGRMKTAFIKWAKQNDLFVKTALGRREAMA